VEERKDACKKVKHFWRAFEVICAFPAADMEGSEGVGEKARGRGPGE